MRRYLGLRDWVVVVALAIVAVIGLAAGGVFEDRTSPADRAVRDLADSILRAGD